MDFIKTLEHAYTNIENQPELLLPELVNELKNWFYLYPQHPFLHPCIIDGQTALVCHAQLRQLSPDAYFVLVNICQKYGLYLKQDSRSVKLHRSINRRTNTAVVIGFCLGMMSVPALSRDKATESLFAQKQTTQLVLGVNHISAQVKQINGQRIISLRHVAPPSAEQVLKTYKQTKKIQALDPVALYKITRFLKQAYQYQTGDPVTIKVDLKKMANYYAKYPQVVELITELSDKNVLLKYKKSHWQAQALGTQHSVDQVTVYFDTRVGAQLWMHVDCKANLACSITPADALLHELLHAKLMIVDSEEFIQQGGMKPTLYLFDHEKQVIEKENFLYQQMSQQDGLARPIRHRHTGALIQASCALCLPIQ